MRNDPDALGLVPEGMRDAGLCRMAVGLNALAFLDVPPDVADKGMCRDALEWAVRNNEGHIYVRLVFPAIPEQFLDEEMCDMAMKADPCIMECVPPCFLTVERCEEAILRAAKEDKEKAKSLMKCVPPEWRTRKMFDAAGIVPVSRHAVTGGQLRAVMPDGPISAPKDFKD